MNTMIDRIIRYSIHNKLMVLLFVAGIVGFGVYALLNIPIGAVPDITNNQVQVITTSRNLATEDVEKFLTYPVELEMANLPGVREIRSVSKFGLSVVTIVFQDRIGTFVPRQLIAEKIKLAEERIPAGFGSPFMGPISTGLGEIYQYVLEVDEAHRHLYSLSDLRTIQDWTVRRQLSGIPGVVEVNTWGGHLKQYEVTVDPSRLRAMDLSLTDLYAALQRNNNLAGGGYIEKGSEAWFIRGEGLITSLTDIGNIVIETRDGIPLRVKDVATIGFGHATRFGAITGNGEGEKVLGQVMMLKDANSRKVIEAVKARVAEISSSLPPGITINPFLERSELIGKTTMTIIENLVLGCLIVVFVVLVLLGNLRSGLVVASVIPLTLFFALSLMYIFGVDANLMSLGAIDFGIIIDGAVIIIEFIAFRISAERAALLAMPPQEQARYKDEITFKGASKMMHAAVFGQLIIIIVFIPILSLVNVEGKMFRPMALVFCFALIGAMLLCFTYVPVMASLFIKPVDPAKRTISTRLLSLLERLYKPSIHWALHHKPLVLGLAMGLLLTATGLFSRMGGEFVPTLDEGDFVIQPVLKTGLSLSETIETTTRIEKILQGFPEVAQVVSRIGAAEVPTDPMSMEESDVIIKLHPKKDWVTADTKDGLADAFKEALEAIPGLEVEFTQPIEMRFNELITGVRADLAIKIFGEDLNVLYAKAEAIRDAIDNVPGAADISIEKIVGLPQLSIRYDRERIARYGLSVDALNDMIGLGFAGMPAGSILEGERKFDLVIRFDEAHRRSLERLASTPVPTPDGHELPLGELAEIRYTKGPAKISRDNTQRRIVVGVNVRNRDLESVVRDVQAIIEREIDLPTGYTIDYGGQFENLRSARARLMIAVPIALLLIFILLFFAFDSIRDALLIYSAIPLSAVGGVVLLYLREMPFSISAGVGFIALFGIAVLNGIVLIEEFKELKAHGIADMNTRIITGAHNRLRPVLLTASAAALGFLPMAVSTSAGAEIQRPLATVVIGGLITATVLTLIVLPVLYALADRKGHPPKRKHHAGVLTAITLLLLAGPLTGQRSVNSDEAFRLAIRHNLALQAAGARIDQATRMQRTAFNPDKASIYYHYDENNVAANGHPIHVWGINQPLAWPGLYSARKQLLGSETLLAQRAYAVDTFLLRKEVETAYLRLVHAKAVFRYQERMDTLHGELAAVSQKRYDAGETSYLELLTALTLREENHLKLHEAEEAIGVARQALNLLIQGDTLYDALGDEMIVLPLRPLDTLGHPGLLWQEENLRVASGQVLVERQSRMPGLDFEAFAGTNAAQDARWYPGIRAGLAVPLLSGEHRARIAAARAGERASQYAVDDYRRRLSDEYSRLLSVLRPLESALTHYRSHGVRYASELRTHARAGLDGGEIDYLQYLQLLQTSREIDGGWLDDLLRYNLTVIDANFLMP